MDPEIRQFRHAATLHTRGKTGTAIRYTPELRRRAVALARVHLAGGQSLMATARMLGLRSRTLTLWLRREPRSFRQVKLTVPASPPAPEAPSGRVVLITPQGFRVEGLDPGDVATVVRSLS